MERAEGCKACADRDGRGEVGHIDGMGWDGTYRWDGMGEVEHIGEERRDGTGGMGWDRTYREERLGQMTRDRK